MNMVLAGDWRWQVYEKALAAKPLPKALWNQRLRKVGRVFCGLYRRHYEYPRG